MTTTTLNKKSTHQEHIDLDNKEMLLMDNMGLIYKFARRYDHQLLSDIVQEACIGLLIAADRYEYGHGTKFSTYASFWINQAVNRGYQKIKREVRLPSTTLENISKIKKVVTQYMTENHRAPSSEEIAQLTGLQSHKVDYYRQIDKTPVSLDTIVNDNADCLVESVEDEEALNYQIDLDNEGKKDLLHDALTALPEKEYQILSMHFGLNSQPAKSLAEIGRLFNVSRERVRQIKDRALKHIRESHFGEMLASYR